MSDKEILSAITKVKGLQGMTVNVRLYFTGLFNEFESCDFQTKRKQYLF